MKYIKSILFLISPLLVFSQAELPQARVNFCKTKVEVSQPTQYVETVKQTSKHLNNANLSFQLTNTTESITAFHYLYATNINNIPLYGIQLKINVSKNGFITSYSENVPEHFEIAESNFPIETVKNAFVQNHQNKRATKFEDVYVYSDGKFIPCTKISVFKNDFNDVEFLIDGKGNTLIERNINYMYHASTSQDSVVKATAFNPDPLTTAGVVYGSPYVDNSDNDVTELNAQRDTVDIKVTFRNDTFLLQNSYCAIKELSSPNIKPAFSVTTANFLFTRAQSGFEDVNAFYHINTFQNHMQSLGFTLVNYPIEVDPHALSGSDNSMFVPTNTPPSLLFGEGGVDDAEDADVVVHEYGHAISFSAAPNTNTGNERLALDEALGDYLASSYSRSINPYKWENVFSWDGHNTFWAGRSSISTKHYPEDLSGSDYYANAPLWSSTIMEIWGDIGRANADQIQLESWFDYFTNMTLANAAVFYVRADSALNGGANYIPIATRFCNRGLLTGSYCTISIHEKKSADNSFSLINTISFATGGNAKIISKENQSATIELYSVDGKLISSNTVKNINGHEINSSALSSGVYLLKIKSDLASTNFKLIRQ